MVNKVAYENEIIIKIRNFSLGDSGGKRGSKTMGLSKG